MVAADPLALQAGALAGGAGAYLGQGVEVEAYRRLRDSFLDVQYRGQSMAMAGHETSARALSSIEASLNEPGDGGIGALLSHLLERLGRRRELPREPARPPGADRPRRHARRPRSAPSTPASRPSRPRPPPSTRRSPAPRARSPPRPPRSSAST